MIDTGTQQVVYVEREPGLFEGVEVELGPRAGGFYPVISGLTAGDKIASAGSFLLDAETRLNPAAASAYFGASGNGGASSSKSSTSSARATAKKSGKLSAAELEQIGKLPPEDRAKAIAQAVCPVTDEPLGSMGPPVKVIVEGEAVFLCCKGCERDVRENPEQMLAKARKLRGEGNEPSKTKEPSEAPPGHQH